MDSTHDRRARHRQVALNLTIAVVTAAVAGGGAALAAGGDATPATSNPSAGAVECAKTAQDARDRGPLGKNDPIVKEARARLEALVADGDIEQTEADVVLRDVIAGSVEPEALVRAGDVSAAHMPTINQALREVKQANAPANGAEAGDVKQAAAVKRAKLAAGG
jgi:hypothetical protein